MRISVLEACLGIVSFRGWGMNTHGIFFLNRSVAAWTTVLGNVAKPTHHQERRKWVLWKMDMVEGSRGAETEKTRAMSIAREASALESVIVESIGFVVDVEGGGGRREARGSIAVRE